MAGFVPDIDVVVGVPVCTCWVADSVAELLLMYRKFFRSLTELHNRTLDVIAHLMQFQKTEVHARCFLEQGQYSLFW